MLTNNIFVLVQLFLILTNGQNIDPVHKDLIDNLIENEFMEFNTVPGFSLSITSVNGEILYNRGYGFSDIENGKKTSNDTLFAIGSVSKSFTATIVAKTLYELFPELRESVLDVPIGKLNPNLLNFTLGDRFRSEVTSFRDLLAHRTCLMPDPLGFAVGAFNDQSEFVFRQRYAKEICSVRSNFEYNNAIVAMAGEYIAVLANTTFNNMLRNLFEDIGMTDTTFIENSMNFSSMDSFAKPYYYLDGELHLYNSELLKIVSVSPGAGGILSSANDMAKYMEFHLSYGKVGNQQLVPENVMRWLHYPSSLLPVLKLKKNETDVMSGRYAFGLGLTLGIYDGWEYSDHSGYWPPYSSLMTLYPSKELGIFSSINGPSLLYRLDGFTLEDLHAKIFDILRGKVYTSQRLLKSKDKTFLSTKINNDISGIRNFISTNKKISGNEKNGDYKKQKDSGELVGLYGNGQSGELEIEMRYDGASNSSRLYLNYYWATGFLNETQNVNIYSVNLDSDLIHVAYAMGESSLEIILDFSSNNTVSFPNLGIFTKNLTLDKLPLIPWDPQSCAPSE